MTINVTREEFDSKMEHIDARLKDLQDDQAVMKGDVKFLLRSVDDIKTTLAAHPFTQPIQLVLPPGLVLPAAAPETNTLKTWKDKLSSAALVAVMLFFLLLVAVAASSILSPEALKLGKTVIESSAK